MNGGASFLSDEVERRAWWGKHPTSTYVKMCLGANEYTVLVQEVCCYGTSRHPDVGGPGDHGPPLFCQNIIRRNVSLKSSFCS